MHDIPLAAVHTDKSRASETDVKQAIERAGSREGWTFDDEGPGALRATRTRKNQAAVVAIAYQVSAYGIRYRDSRNMKFRRRPMSDIGGTIHDPDYATIDKAYNDWVLSLDRAIRAELLALH